MASEAAHPSLPRRQLGKYIRNAREAASLGQREIAQMMQWSISTQSRLERGELGKIRDRDLRELGQALGFTDEETAAMVGLLQQAAEKRWWHSFGDLIPESFDVYVGLETDAYSLDIYRPDIVPGLFQTADYAAALDRIYFPTDSEEEQDRRIQLKLRRQAIITRKAKPVNVDLVLNESVLNMTVGSPAIMAAQLRRLADLSLRPNVTIRILPSKAGFPVGMSVGPFVILDFAADAKGVIPPTIIYVENYTGDMYLEAESDVKRYRGASTIIQRAALDVVMSRNLLRQAAKEHLA